MNDLIIRKITRDDYSFVKATWLRNFKDHGEAVRFIRNSIYFENHAALIDNIIARGMTLVASHVDEPDVILGFLVCEPGIIHYAYTTIKARRLGICRELMHEAKIMQPFSYSHRTPDSAAFQESHTSITYNPYLI